MVVIAVYLMCRLGVLCVRGFFIVTRLSAMSILRFSAKLFLFLPLALIPLRAATQVRYGDFFEDRTLRIDYHRIGNRHFDTVEVARFVSKRGGWSGSTTSLLDGFGNGSYRVLVHDARSGLLLYSHCYNTIFNEYCGTPQGDSAVVAYEEVVNVPWPKAEVSISMQKMDEAQQYVTQSVFHFSPDAMVASPDHGVSYRTLQYRGDCHHKVDVVIVPEGYAAADSLKMYADFERFLSILFAKEPFLSRRDDFNVYGVVAFGEESGVSNATKGVMVKSAVGATYYTFGAARYLMTFNLFALHDLIDGVPADHIVIMANSDIYGGGGIYNFYAVSSLTKTAASVLPHELGHSIGGLADEYVDENLSYGDIHKPTVEPCEPNITTLVDFASKWESMLDANTAVPTPDDLSVPKGTNGPLGCYEGAGYHPKGIYRPTMHCMMRDYAPFCPVCLRHLNLVIDTFVK